MLSRLNPFSPNFKHGVHPAELKEQTVNLPIQRIPFRENYILLLNQHNGVPSVPIVSAGDKVSRGQQIAEPGGFVSVALHSPISGTVTQVGEFRASDGNFSPGIEITADAFATQEMSGEATVDWQTLPQDEFISAVQHAGIVGMGGAAFPAHVKFALPEGARIRYLLINGAECEPYLTNDHRLLLERPEALLAGAELIRQQLGAEETVIGIEENKADAIPVLQQHIPAGHPVRLVTLSVKYPQGAEKMLIKAVFDREVPAGLLPRDVEVNVNNVSTVIAVYDALAGGLPLTERVITVAGPGVTYPANLLVPLGTPVRDILEYCGGLKPETREVVMGGPMMGRPIASLDAPVVKGTSGILALTEQETLRKQEYPCIRCGRCLDACPYFLNPSRLARLSRARLFDSMMDYHIMDCVECGSCTYSCPSGIPIVQLIRTGKDHLRRNSQDNKS